MIVLYQRLVCSIPTLGIRCTDAWYSMYQSLVLAVPMFGIRRTCLWYLPYQVPVQNWYHDVIKERRNGNGARVYGANLDAKIAHGKEAQLQLGFTAQRSRYTREEVWTQVDGKDLTTKRMPRTPDYYGYFTFSSAPLKNFDFSLSGTYTGKMIVPHYAGYIAEDRMETTPQFFDLNLKLNYTFVLHDHIKFQLNTGVQNIFNSFQKDLDKGEFRDAGYFYGPTQPRTFFIGFKIMN